MPSFSLQRKEDANYIIKKQSSSTYGTFKGLIKSLFEKYDLQLIFEMN